MKWVILVILLLAGCSDIETVEINGKIIDVMIADDEDEWRAGLAGRTLNENEGMLFIFEAETYRRFWMKDMKIPLDMIFISQDGSIVDIKENFQPCKDDCEYYISREPAYYVLEVNAGFAEKNNIKVGDKVNI